ncbi:protein CWC15, partial [Tremellales sp. Uapishka_1]
MSQAHRPTWNPAMGRETKAGSQQVSKLQLPSHTKLKFRQPGQTSIKEVQRRDLRAELIEAERIASEKKRRAAGLPALAPVSNGLRIENGEEESSKRRKVEEELDLDKDDEEEGEGEANGVDKGKGKAVDQDADEEDDDDSDSDSDSDSDDDTAALMAELAKIKAERADEKARLDAEQSASAAIDREAEIATGNPLLNLQAALGQAPSTPSAASTTSTAGFVVKRRWDDDLIFKNQAAGVDDKPKKGEFVNDLLRSEFHKKFMLKFIK